jgi:hypothetical protein
MVMPITRKDQNGDLYDLVRILLNELREHPFGRYDNFIDAAPRIYDINPSAPEPYTPAAQIRKMWIGGRGTKGDLSIRVFGGCPRLDDQRASTGYRSRS